MLQKILFLFLLGSSLLASGQQKGTFYHTRSSHVIFSSEAQAELIRASSDQLKGILDLSQSTFAFKVSIGSFTGFNNPLQRGHFNENYMESDTYPEATYAGKIIENIDYSKKGTYIVRSKGKLIIHGITQERIIKATINIMDNRIVVQSNFTVLLADYNIKIPRIVDNNLSKEIKVSVTATFINK
jgi:hypothetical protein